MCDKLRIPRRPPSIFGARRGEIQDDLDPVSISAPTSWCASVVPCSVTAAMLTSRFGPICSIALGSKEMDRRCQLPFRASGSSSSLMAVRYTEPIRTLGRSVPSQVPGLDARRRVVLIVDPLICFSCPRDHLLFAVQPKEIKRGPHRLGDAAECGRRGARPRHPRPAFTFSRSRTVCQM